LANRLAQAYALWMALLPSLNPRIVEALYAEAIGLAEAVRQRFERLRLETVQNAGADDEDLRRVQVSCEALRTTTRVMHCLAWLLNHRAHFAGELSELQLRRHGRLIANFPASEIAVVEGLPADVQMLVHESERLYQRIQRLEASWRTQGMTGDSAVRRLRERLVRAVGDAPTAA
jgi:regulator of CtrA degradation